VTRSVQVTILFPTEKTSLRKIFGNIQLPDIIMRVAIHISPLTTGSESRFVQCK